MAALLLVGCSTDPEQSRAVPVERPTTPDGAPVTRIGPTANFDPSAGVVPTPNNLLFLGSTDGTLNIPVADPTDFTNPQVAINALDGWSTNAPIVTTFSNAVNPATVTAGGSVRMFEVTLSGVGGAVTSVVRQLGANEFLPVMATPTTLVILPLRPLAQKSHYAIALTDTIADADGGHVVPSQIYAIIKNTSPLVVDGRSTIVLPLANAQALEPLRQLTNAAETAIAAAAGISRDRIVLSWTVSTQSVTDVLDHIAANVTAAANRFAPTGQTTAAIGGSGAASIYFGYIDLPYYLQAPGDVSPAVPARVLSGHWQGAGGSNLTRFNPAPVVRSTQRVPALLTIPVAAAPAAGYPVVIYQHGITGNRTHALAIADAAAQAGRAVLSIDQPLHGLPNDATSTTFSFYAHNAAGVHATAGFAANERHFNVDLVNNTTGAPGADGVIDASGAHTINLQRLLTSRDNLRQASADLLTVIATIPSLTTVDARRFDATAIHFVGHSLGAMVGIPAVGATQSVRSASYKAPGGGIARLLHGSASFGPRIRAGLAAAGVSFPSAAYDSFMFAAQTVIDSADPLNHAVRAATRAPTHMMLVVGDGANVLPDQVVPNSVAGAPLSGSNPLAALMGLQTISQTTTDAAGLRGLVRFVAGDHGSLISTTASAAATVEMQSQVATFMATFGATIRVNNPAVVRQP